MPNWTYNTLKTNNPNIFPSLMDEGGNFDFNKLIPMPESLNIESGSSTDRAIAFYLTERLTKSASEVGLDKYVSNMFDNNWAETVVERLKNYDMSNEEADKLYSMGKQYLFNRENYGCYTWYEWCNRNWGTKWGACETCFSADELCEVSFSTAWAAPEPIFQKLCEMFPDAEINFHCEYEEGFVIEYENENGGLIQTNEYELNYDDEDEDWDEDEDNIDEE